MAERIANLPDGRYRVLKAAGDMYYEVSRKGGTTTVVGPVAFTLNIGDAIEIQDRRVIKLPK